MKNWKIGTRIIAGFGAVIAIAAASVVIGIGFFMILDKEFMPAEDQGRYLVRLETPIDYSLPRADGVMRKIDEQLRQRPEVRSTFYVTGSDLTICSRPATRRIRWPVRRR